MTAISLNLRGLQWPLDKWDALVITLLQSEFIEPTGDTTNHTETTQIIKINVGSRNEEKTGVPKEKASQSRCKEPTDSTHRSGNRTWATLVEGECCAHKLTQKAYLSEFVLPFVADVSIIFVI